LRSFFKASSDLSTEPIAKELLVHLYAEKAERVNLAALLDSTVRLQVQRHGLNEYHFGNIEEGFDDHRPPRRIPISTSSSCSTSGFYDIWEADFVSADKMRGVGWAFCYQHPPTADSRTTGSRPAM